MLKEINVDYRKCAEGLLELTDEYDPTPSFVRFEDKLSDGHVKISWLIGALTRINENVKRHYPDCEGALDFHSGYEGDGIRVGISAVREETKEEAIERLEREIAWQKKIHAIVRGNQDSSVAALMDQLQTIEASGDEA